MESCSVMAFYLLLSIIYALIGFLFGTDFRISITHNLFVIAIIVIRERWMEGSEREPEGGNGKSEETERDRENVRKWGEKRIKHTWF